MAFQHPKTDKITTGLLKTTLFAFIACMALVSGAPDTEGKIAEGDGFVITEDDITSLRAKFSLSSTVSEELNKHFYYTRALMMRLFAEEARVQGLGGPDIKKEGRLPFEQQEVLYEAYRKKLLADTPV